MKFTDSMVTLAGRSVLILLCVLSFILIPEVKSQNSTPESKDKLQLYEDAIIKGEEFLAAKEYAKAKAEYQKALSIDPAAKYPKDKLTYIRKFYVDPADEARYTQAMASGSQLMATKKYKDAKAQFEIAVNIKPEDKTSRDNLMEAEKAATDFDVMTNRYNSLIAEADKQYAAKDYTKAREAYISAGETDPAAAWPKQRIAEIDSRLKADQTLREAYDKALADGDEAYMNRDYATAKTLYEQALKLKPGENYPKSMLERVAQGAANQKDAQQNYQNTLASADNFYNKGELEAALAAYNNALKILPGEAYPLAQIDKINKAAEEKKKLDEVYQVALQNGEKLFAAKQYTEAMDAFQQANNLKPSEAYPKQKIGEIAGLLLEIREAERLRSYQAKIEEADGLFSQKKLDEALVSYQKAAEIYPEKNYASGQIAAINKLQKALTEAEEAYRNAIAGADRKFGAADWEAAITGYELALGYKPDEAYPKSQVSKARESLAAEKLTEETYNSGITEADRKYTAGDLDGAAALYTEMLKIKPGSSYPSAQLNLIAEAKQALQSKEEQYQQFVLSGDQLFQAGNLQASAENYTKASGLKPDEKYPAEQLKKVQQQIELQQKKRAEYDVLIASADKLFNENKQEESLSSYQKALAVLPEETYPQQQIGVIGKLIEQRKSLEENYARNISEGEKALKEGKLNSALGYFNDAIALKPEEKLPQDKISQIQQLISKQDAQEKEYQNILQGADQLLAEGKPEAALEKFREAAILKPTETYPGEKIALIEGLIRKNREDSDRFRTLIAEADRNYQQKSWEAAREKYTEASKVFPGDKYATEKIEEISTMLKGIAAKDEMYTNAVADGDRYFEAEDWEQSIAAYSSALRIKPDETYPSKQLDLINQKKAELRQIDDSYLALIASADKLFEGKEYKNAQYDYEKAAKLKPDAPYPAERLTEIRVILYEQEQLANKDYNDAIENGNRLFTLQDYNSARKYYETAAALKPADNYPKNKIIEINNILMERARNIMDAYNKVIMKADQAYQDKIFDQAIDAYEEAKLVNPEQTYSDEMIARIRKYMEDHAMVDLVNAPVLIQPDTEQKFRFKPIEMRLRKNNYIILKARKTGETEPKVYVNYGIDGQKSGGIVLRSIKSQETSDYMVRVSIQDRWYRLDNNWISIYAEGASVEISRMQISQGD